MHTHMHAHMRTHAHAYAHALREASMLEIKSQGTSKKRKRKKLHAVVSRKAMQASMHKCQRLMCAHLWREIHRHTVSQ